MHRLTPTVCSKASVGDTAQLEDFRDGKVYWVTKLADNNCWMTQNLDYDDPNATRYTAPNQPNSWPGSNDDTARYYDPGDYYYSNQSSWTNCSGVADGLTNASCASNGWSTTGDSHYHVGNYYNWNSATNGTGKAAASAGAIASDSICPDGWKLPTSNVTTSGSFGGLTSGLTQTTLRQDPYYFIPGGYVSSGGLSYAGGRGYYWSSTARDGSNAYNLRFLSSEVDPSNNLSRFRGLSVRCLVQGS